MINRGSRKAELFYFPPAVRIDLIPTTFQHASDDERAMALVFAGVLEG